MICPDLKTRGYCAKGDACRHSHVFKLCDLCNVILESQTALASHNQGRRHTRNLYHVGIGVDGNCSVCQTSYTDAGTATITTFVAHCATPSHRQRILEGFEFHQPLAADPLAGILPGSVPCHTCNRAITDSHWEAHLKSPVHRRGLLYKAIKMTLEEAEADTDSIEVKTEAGHIVEFGVIDISSRATWTQNIHIELTAPGTIFLVDIRLSSITTKSKAWSRTPFQVPGWRGRLTEGTPISLPIHFNTVGMRGKFEDRIELVFTDARAKHHLTIVRPMRAIVGNKAELNALAPTTPYSALPLQPRAREGEVVDGVRPRGFSEIEWVIKLDEYLVPPSVSKILGVGSLNKQINALKAGFLPHEINSRTYNQHWSTLLHVEEFQMTIDLQRYDMKKVHINPQDRLHVLHVPGLAEKRPSVLVGDKIRVQIPESGRKWFAGYVHKVEELQVFLGFGPQFSGISGQVYDVRFSPGRTSLRRMHQALGIAWDSPRVLFPEIGHFSDLLPVADVDNLEPFNRLLRSNPEQMLAVKTILRLPPGSAPFGIWGPPGTGKTVVVVETTRQIRARNPETRVLLCAPSNSAADLIAERLQQQGVGPSEMFRLNAPSRPIHLLPSVLKSYSSTNAGGFAVPVLDVLAKYRIIVTTCVSASLLYGIGIQRGHFDYILFDEAGQSSEPEAMIPIRTLASPETNIVFSGDPKQLGPVVRSPVAIELKLDKSYLERLMDRDAYSEEIGRGISFVKLIQNFRNHPAILRFPNDAFYRGELEAHADPAVTNSLSRFEKLPNPHFPVIFHSMSGEDQREGTSPSFFNSHEASVVREYVQALREDQRFRLSENDIGVIAPYNLQCAKIRSLINKPALVKRRRGVLKVGSVEEFQGQERRVIIISTVRSHPDFLDFHIRHTLGFVANPRRFNVAVTRAQALLVVIGNADILGLDDLWHDFLDYVHAGGGWVGKPRPWDDGEPSFGIKARRIGEREENMEEVTRRIQTAILDNLEGSGSRADEDVEDSDIPWRDDE